MLGLGLQEGRTGLDRVGWLERGTGSGLSSLFGSVFYAFGVLRFERRAVAREGPGRPCAGWVAPLRALQRKASSLRECVTTDIPDSYLYESMGAVRTTATFARRRRH